MARDAVDWSETSYVQTVQAGKTILGEQGKNITEVPISALHADNILEHSAKASWFAPDSSVLATLVDAIDAAVTR